MSQEILSQDLWSLPRKFLLTREAHKRKKGPTMVDYSSKKTSPVIIGAFPPSCYNTQARRGAFYWLYSSRNHNREGL